jgi:hypothetical protein
MIPYQSPQMVLHGDNPVPIHPPCPHHAEFKPLPLGNMALFPGDPDDFPEPLMIPRTITEIWDVP